MDFKWIAQALTIVIKKLWMVCFAIFYSIMWTVHGTPSSIHFSFALSVQHPWVIYRFKKNHTICTAIATNMQTKRVVIILAECNLFANEFAGPHKCFITLQRQSQCQWTTAKPHLQFELVIVMNGLIRQQLGLLENTISIRYESLLLQLQHAKFGLQK